MEGSVSGLVTSSYVRSGGGGDSATFVQGVSRRFSVGWWIIEASVSGEVGCRAIRSWAIGRLKHSFCLRFSSPKHADDVKVSGLGAPGCSMTP